MERLINKNNIYHNIKNLLENEEEATVIVERLNRYHFALRISDGQNLKLNHKESFEAILNTYSKIAFYLLTRLIGFDYVEEVKQTGFELAGYCWEIISRNKDVSKTEIEENKFLSSVCYSLAGNTANSIVMARSIDSEEYKLYKLFLCREYRKIINMNFNESELIENAIKKMAFSLMYKNDFEQEQLLIKEVMYYIKQNDSSEVYYFRLICACYSKMCENSIRNLAVSRPNLQNYLDILSQKEKIYELWESQKKVTNQLNDILDNMYVSYISLPTSAGKTLLAELILYNYVSLKGGLQFYIVPSLALENEVRIKFGKRFRKVNTKVLNNIELDDSGNITIPQIVVATPEKISIILRNNKDVFQRLNCVIFDEFHKVSSGTRGWFEEALTIWLNSLRKKYDYKMVLISAVADDVEKSLNMDITKVYKNEWTPTRKQYCKFVRSANDKKIYGRDSVKRGEEIHQQYDLIMKYSGDARFVIENVFSQDTFGKVRSSGKDENRSDKKSDVAWKAINCIRERPLMVFFLTKRGLNSFVKKSSFYAERSFEGERLSDSIAQILGESHILVECLKYGVAFHDGDLPDDVRSIIENEFRKGTVSIIACTTTLADGINLPAKAILMAEIFSRGFGGSEKRLLNIGDYKNIVGRVGRALTDTEGRIYLIEYPEFYWLENEFNKYYSGASIISKLTSVLDEEVPLIEPEDIKTYDINTYKNILQLQLLIFTLIDQDEDFEMFYQKFIKNQILRVSEAKKNTILNYGKKYFELAKTLSPEYLAQNTITGVSFETNEKLKGISSRIIDCSNVFEVITEEIYLQLLECVEFSPDMCNVNHYEAFSVWIAGESARRIAEIIGTNVNGDKYENATKYIKNVFQYIAPWMFGCLSVYLYEYLEAKRVVDQLRNQVKYGTQDDDVIALCNKGISSRDLAIEISRIYHNVCGNDNIIDWIIKVDEKILYRELIELFDVSILQQIGMLRRENQNKSSYFSKSNKVKCRLILKDSHANIREIVEALKTRVIYLVHDYSNPFNEYRVDIKTDILSIGYLPNIISEEICEMIDAEEILQCTFAESDDKNIWICISRDNII